MKLRCEKNSIRLRLRKSDLNRLQAEGSIRNEVSFAFGMSFSWELHLDQNAETVHAEGYGSHIKISLPLALATQWIDSQQVGIEHFQPIDRQNQLHILVEKDFPCKDRPEEDKADTFTELATQTAAAC